MKLGQKIAAGGAIGLILFGIGRILWLNNKRRKEQANQYKREQEREQGHSSNDNLA